MESNMTDRTQKRQLAATAQLERDAIAADLDRRADALRDSIAKQRTKTEKAACYVASTALRTAAEHVRAGIEFLGG